MEKKAQVIEIQHNQLQKGKFLILSHSYIYYAISDKYSFGNTFWAINENQFADNVTFVSYINPVCQCVITDSCSVT